MTRSRGLCRNIIELSFEASGTIEIYAIFRAVALIFVVLFLVFGGTPGATAQDGGITAMITEVESRNFPRVVISVAVSDADGPVPDLSAADVQLFEDDVEVPPDSVTVEESVLENLRLVLALDTSVLEDELTEMQQATIALFDSLSPKDRLAVVGFGDEINLMRGFTNNTEELQKAIVSLTPEGEFTTLHQAIVEAAQLTEQFQAGRRAVVVITNSQNNSGALSVEETIAQVQASGVPVYVIGFGQRVQAVQPLKEQLSSTGGQYLTLTGVDQVQETLPQVIAQLRQGYKITFLSALEADRAKHNLSLVATYQDSSGQTEGSFEIAPGTIGVELPGLTEEQSVSGVVNLRPQVTSLAPLASVEYLLDGQSLAEVESAPYSFEWDSAAVEAGSHQLTVKATDQAGNEGRIDLNVTVAAPLRVEISTSQTEIRLGDAVPVTADIEVMTDLAKVDLLIDGDLLDSKTAPPYRFDFDSDRYTPGSHEVVLRVEDEAGHVAEDSMTLQFLPPPAPQPDWFSRLINNPWVRLSAILSIALIAMGAILLVAVILLRMIRLWQLKRSQRKLRLEILNAGNIESRYQLQAREPSGSLKFEFTLDGRKLAWLLPPQVTPATGRSNGTAIQTQPLAQGYEPIRPATAAAPSPDVSTGPTTGPGARQTMRKAGEKQAQAQGCLYTISDILDTLGQLLPGAAGRAVQRASGQLYGGHVAIDRAARTPAYMARTAQNLGGQVSGAAPSRPSGASATVDRGDTGRPSSQSRAETWGTSPQPGPRYQPIIQSRPEPVTDDTPKETHSWVETPFIEPTGKLFVDLLITPTNPYRKQTYTFTLLSKSGEQIEALPSSEQGMADIAGISWFGRYAPVLLVMLVTLGLIGGVAWLTFWRLGQMGALSGLLVFA